MANRTATLRLSLGYPDTTGIAKTYNVPVVLAPFVAENEGAVDVAADAVEGADIDIPFGGVGGATLAIVVNNTSQDISLTINAGTDPAQDLPPGGVFVHAGPTLPSGAPLSSISAKLTDDQSALENIAFFIVGDPG